MTVEMVTAIFGGVVLLMGAITTMIIQLRKIHSLVNSKMTEALNEIAELKKYVSPKEAVKAAEDSKIVKEV